MRNRRGNLQQSSRRVRFVRRHWVTARSGTSCVEKLLCCSVSGRNQLTQPDCCCCSRAARASGWSRCIPPRRDTLPTACVPRHVVSRGGNRSRVQPVQQRGRGRVRRVCVTSAHARWPLTTPHAAMSAESVRCLLSNTLHTHARTQHPSAVHRCTRCCRPSAGRAVQRRCPGICGRRGVRRRQGRGTK